jgi:hypothetical protein
LSRLRFLFASAALIALATAFVACGGSSSNNENPQTVVDNATLKGIQSGNVNLSLSVKAKGKEGGNLDVSLSGPFQGEGKGKLPQLDLKAKANGSIKGENINFEGGLTLLPNSAYVDYKGVEYEVDPTTFSYVKSALKQAQQQGGKESSGGGGACQEAAGKLKLSDFVEKLSNEGSADVGGTGTTKVSGDLNVSGAIGSLVKLAENPACSSQLGATGAFPSTAELGKAKGEVEKALKAAHVDLYVGGDHIVRRVTAQLTIEPPKGSGKGPESVELELDLSLTGVNAKQTIEAPQGAKPLNELFLKLGINPIELLGGAGGKGGASGLGGLGGLLKGLGGAAGGTSGMGGSTGGGASVGGSPGTGAQQAYLKCLQGAKTPVDLQKCAAMLKM